MELQTTLGQQGWAFLYDRYDYLSGVVIKFSLNFSI